MSVGRLHTSVGRLRACRAARSDVTRLARLYAGRGGCHGGSWLLPQQAREPSVRMPQPWRRCTLISLNRPGGGGSGAGPAQLQQRTVPSVRIAQWV